MRRILVFLISFVTLFIGVESVDAFSSKLTLNKNNIGANTEVEVTLSVSELSATGLAVGTYYIDFDASKLTYEGIVRRGQSKPVGDFNLVDNGSGKITLLYLDSQGGPNKLGNGDVITLKFKSKAGVTTGNSTFSLSGKGFADSNNATPITSTFAGVTLNYKVVSSDANLTALSVTGATISPSFSAGQLTYTATVASNVSSVTINATGATGSSVTGTGTKTLNYGDNNFNIVVTAENGTTKKTYSIKITRTDDRSNNSKLKSLTPSLGTISFSPSTLNYTITLASDQSAFSVQAEADDAKATIAYSPAKNITVNKGETKTISIVVTAENGSKTTYKVNVKRTDDRNTDNTLKSLSVTGTDIKLSNNVATYTATVKNNVSSVTINAVVNDDKAKVTGTGKVNLKVGKNTFNVVVTAENQTKKAYTVVIVREDSNGNAVALSENNYLKSLTIEGKDLTFNADKATYDMTATIDEATFKISYEVADSHARAEVLGNTANSKKIEIVVTAENGNKRTYTINVLREGQTEENFEPASDSDADKTLLYISLGAGVFFILFVIFVTVGAKKQKDDQTM